MQYAQGSHGGPDIDDRNRVIVNTTGNLANQKWERVFQGIGFDVDYFCGQATELDSAKVVTANNIDGLINSSS